MKLMAEQGGSFSHHPDNAVITVETRNGWREKALEIEPAIAYELGLWLRTHYPLPPAK